MRLLDAFFALRPLVLVPAWSFFLLGCDAAFPALRFGLLSAVLAGAYLVNQVTDFESDRLNGKGLFLQRGIFTRHAYLWWGVGLAIGALGVALLRQERFVWLGTAAALGFAYSVPPLRLVSRPGFDLAANALGYGGVALVLGAPSLPAVGALRFAACTLAVACVFLHTTLLDLEGDRRTHKRTSGVALGPAAARAGAAAAGAAAVACAVAAKSPGIAAASSATALLAAIALLRPEVVSSRTVVVGATAAFAVAAGVRFPAFLIALFLLVVATRLYYRHRFALRYPAL